MDLSFIFYIFAAFIFIPGTFFLLSMFGKSLAGGIAAIGMLILFILFGLQFYNSDGTLVTAPVTSWPPSINQCPDFLTLYKMSAVAGVGDTAALPASYVCIDTVGVAPQTSTSIQKFTPSSTSTPLPNQIFNLSTDMTHIIQECKNKNVTWEGIWDGIQAYPNTIPVLPSL